MWSLGNKVFVLEVYDVTYVTCGLAFFGLIPGVEELWLESSTSVGKILFRYHNIFEDKFRDWTTKYQLIPFLTTITLSNQELVSESVIKNWYVLILHCLITSNAHEFIWWFPYNIRTVATDTLLREGGWSHIDPLSEITQNTCTFTDFHISCWFNANWTV